MNRAAAVTTRRKGKGKGKGKIVNAIGVRDSGIITTRNGAESATQTKVVTMIHVKLRVGKSKLKGRKNPAKSVTLHQKDHSVVDTENVLDSMNANVKKVGVEIIVV